MSKIITDKEKIQHQEEIIESLTEEIQEWTDAYIKLVEKLRVIENSKLKGVHEDTLTEHQFSEIEKDKENEVLKKENEHLYELINILRLKEKRL